MEINTGDGGGGRRERQRVVRTTCHQSAVVDLSGGHLGAKQSNKNKNPTTAWLALTLLGESYAIFSMMCILFQNDILLYVLLQPNKSELHHY